MGWTLQEVLRIWQQREDDEIPLVLPMAAESMARAVEDEARLAMAEARRTLRAGEVVGMRQVEQRCEAGETWPEDAA
jgi:predicted hotdog family 3-hydroxylacyl-ACP dehydratase